MRVLVANSLLRDLARVFEQLRPRQKFLPQRHPPRPLDFFPIDLIDQFCNAVVHGEHTTFDRKIANHGNPRRSNPGKTIAAIFQRTFPSGQGMFGAMKNPFPGMNPWLERNWQEAHSSLAIYSRDQLQRQMPAGLRVRVEKGVAVDSEERRGRMRPDVHISQSWDGGSGGVALAEPEVATGLLVIEEPPPQRHLEIVDADGRLVTAIEFLSPWNKTPGDGLADYRAKQRTYLSARVNLVEIDLVRRGEFALAVSRSNVPRPFPPYMACVFRGAQPKERQIFPIGLRDPLPRLPVPLRPTDREVALDLQPLLDLCVINGAYGPADYARPADPPLSDEDAAWAATILRAAGMGGGSNVSQSGGQ